MAVAGQPYREAYARLREAQAAVRAGRREQAAQALAAAEALARELPSAPLLGPALYLPSVTGATQDSPGYGLPGDTDLTALEQSIKAAMTDGTVLSVQLALTPGSPGGLLMLNGATLAFAVICPRAA